MSNNNKSKAKPDLQIERRKAPRRAEFGEILLVVKLHEDHYPHFESESGQEQVSLHDGDLILIFGISPCVADMYGVSDTESGQIKIDKGLVYVNIFSISDSHIPLSLENFAIQDQTRVKVAHLA
ncbi:MAG: hypothetical protein RLZZ230_956 [Candidatus Parcubacteria bacterium]|jgi:hypothetical protein